MKMTDQFQKMFVARRLAENAEVSVLLLEADGDDDTPSVMEPGQWFSTSVRIEIGPSLLSQTPVSREVMPGNLNGLDLETSFAMRRSRIVTRAALRKWAAMRMSVVDSSLKVYGVDGFVSRTDLSSRG
jgi:hypothetical protein